MQEPPSPENEATRLQALRLMEILDTQPEQRFDRITKIAQDLFEVPIALVSLIDSDRQWFKSCQGLGVRETPRSISFCGHAILGQDIFYVPDASQDVRFADNPLVTGPPDIRFYAGAPLNVGGDLRVGTLCIIDTEPRKFSAADFAKLRDLADWVQDELNMHKLAEATAIIHGQETRLRALLSNIADALLTVGEDGRVRSANTPAAQLFGLPSRELLGLDLQQLLPDFAAEQFAGLLREQQATDAEGIPKVNRVTGARDIQGREYAVDVTVTAMDLPDGRTYILSLRDITDAKRLELMKREFVSIVSHELRTPLTAIRGALGLVIGGAVGTVPDKIAEMIGIADNNCKRLINLVNDILDLEKIELGRLTFHMEPLSLVELLHKALQLNDDYAYGFGVDLRLIDASAQDIRIHADENRLLQVLTNLIANAVKYSPAGETVDVEVSRTEDRAQVVIRDRGPGIPPEMQDEIFEKFRQVDSMDTRAKGGTGLGLSIAKAIVEACGGRIGVRCPDSGGSEFFFELPLLAAERSV